MKPFVYPLLLAALTSACSDGPSKAELDAEVRRLCAIDGGVKVYETVALPPEMLDEHGRLRIRVPFKEQGASAGPYFYEIEYKTLVEGNTRLRRTESRIIRSDDRKILGVRVTYGQDGGSWAPSSFSCPAPHASAGLELSVFVNGEHQRAR